MRRTSIVCTIGPKTNSVDMMAQLRDAGMNIVRMNFSHGSYEYHGSVIANAREMAAKVPGKDGTTQVIAIALDTKGPEIRTGLTPDNAEVALPLLATFLCCLRCLCYLCHPSLLAASARCLLVEQIGTVHNLILLVVLTGATDQGQHYHCHYRQGFR